MGIAVTVIAILASGPAFAYLALSLGCAQPLQLFGVMCGHNAILSLIALSLLGWLLALVAVAVINLRRAPLQ